MMCGWRASTSMQLCDVPMVTVWHCSCMRPGHCLPQGAVGEGVDSLPMMGMEEAAMECTASLERKGGIAAVALLH
jgi:hypothetical protein